MLADDSYLVREAVAHVLAEADGIEVVASCRDRDSLLEAIEAERPDVVVTDIRMPPADSDEGLQVAEMLRQTHPAVGVVILSQFAEPRPATGRWRAFHAYRDVTDVIERSHSRT